MNDNCRYDVVGLGTVLIDHVVRLAEYPEVDSKNAAVGDHYQVGGPVPTALAALRRFGRSCCFIGRWGHDPYGRMIDDDFVAEGIDAAGSHRCDQTRTGFAHVWVCGRTARRTIAYQRATEIITPEAIDPDLIAASRVLHLDGWPADTALAAARIAHRAGRTVTLDAGSPKPGMTDLLAHVDVVNAPARFIRQFLDHDDIDTGIKRLLTMGPRLVTITSGHEGAAIGDAHGIVHLPAPAIDPVDTTGAGDVFSGALIHGLLEDWPPQRMLQFAITAAALKCRKLGNREAIPDRREIESHVCPA
ncbi:carbohydrate kinase family protein [Planctomycetales bacterium ZRK34]|nr:carbohydrate kinase family protein [Planctomycetales bacterium ZRK34]